MDDDLAGGHELERRLTARLSTSTIPFPFGTAYLDEEHRDRFVSNFLWASERLGEADAGVLNGEADRILGGAGYGHRTVLVTADEHGQRMAPGFVERGYRVERTITMLHRRDADRPPSVPVAELPFEAVRPLLLEVYRREPQLTPDIVPAFTDQHGKYERVLGVRFFAGRIDGELAGLCELWMDGSDALVEHVDTLKEFRGRGVARAVVLRAIEEARKAGAMRVYIGADDDDWPKELYARLGFDRLGRSWQFIRWPGDATASQERAG